MQLGRYAEAQQSLIRARDEDVCPLRAPSAVEQTVRDFAVEQGIILVDFGQEVEQHSPNHIPGDDLFLDHVHPTIAGNRMLAVNIIASLANRSIVKTGGNWGQEAIDRVARKVEGKLDKEAHAIALRNLAKVLSWAGKDEEAHRLALRAAETVTTDANTLYMAANALLQQGKAAEAADEYRRALAIEPHYLEAHNGLGAALQRLGQLEEAAEQYREAIRLRGDFAPSYNNLALVLQQIERPDEAEQNYRRAIQLNPRYATARNNLAVLYLKRNQLADAEQQLRQAIAISPEFVEGYFNLGRVRRQQNQLSEAADLFRRATQINPNYLPAHAELGVLLLGQARDREAATHLRQAINESARPALGVADALAWLLATSSDDDLRDGREALRWAQYCVERTQARSSRALSTLAAAYAELGQFEDAIRWQTQAVRFASGPERAMHTSRLNQLKDGKPLRTRKK
jgi:tetratricopeptide (TPR) repeat protein